MGYDGHWRPEHDYYQILGVVPGANHEELQAAFARRAKQCHPDRGGSHVQMVLLNEAWEVLSNPEVRRRYDEIIAQRASPQAQEAFVHDVCEARQKAEAYPTEWPLFEQWLSGAAQDFTKAKYGSTTIRLWPFQEVSWPTVEGSLSGRAFVYSGAAAGLVLFCVVFWLVARIWDGPKKDSPLRFVVIFIGFLFIAGGAWVGASLHDGLRMLIDRFMKRREDARRSQCTSPLNILTNCRGCGQRIRLPKSTSKLVVTCPACRCRFTFGPSA